MLYWCKNIISCILEEPIGLQGGHISCPKCQEHQCVNRSWHYRDTRKDFFPPTDNACCKYFSRCSSLQFDKRLRSLDAAETNLVSGKFVCFIAITTYRPAARRQREFDAECLNHIARRLFASVISFHSSFFHKFLTLHTNEIPHNHLRLRRNHRRHTWRNPKNLQRACRRLRHPPGRGR
jgi:hypothetical protein